VTFPSRLQERSQLLQAVRSFFLSRGYVEVDTPIRLPVPLPEIHIKPFASEGWFLQSSPEQCMKRLLARGCTQLFQICHCFRKEEVGRYHQGEFTMLEWYRTGWSYLELMDECEKFLRSLVRSVPDLNGVKDSDNLHWQNRTISLALPWKRLTVAEAFQKYANMPVEQAMEEDMFDEILVTQIEPHLGWDTPIFLYDYPVRLGSLARQKKDDPGIVERFELYIGGIELANGFSELTDSDEQRNRFFAEMNTAQEQGNIYVELPEKFLADLKNMGETAGIALGLDRLFMVLLGCDTVAEVMCMPVQDL
jgi:lysyl-tRNA synthetase class 2